MRAHLHLTECLYIGSYAHTYALWLNLRCYPEVCLPTVQSPTPVVILKAAHPLADGNGLAELGGLLNLVSCLSALHLVRTT